MEEAMKERKPGLDQERDRLRHAIGLSPWLSLSVTDGTGESGVTQGPVHKGRNQRSELKSKRLEGRDRRRWRRIRNFRNLRQGVQWVARTCHSRKDRSKRWELMERWPSPGVTGWTASPMTTDLHQNRGADVRMKENEEQAWRNERVNRVHEPRKRHDAGFGRSGPAIHTLGRQISACFPCLDFAVVPFQLAICCSHVIPWRLTWTHQEWNENSCPMREVGEIMRRNCRNTREHAKNYEEELNKIKDASRRNANVYVYISIYMYVASRLKGFSLLSLALLLVPGTAAVGIHCSLEN